MMNDMAHVTNKKFVPRRAAAPTKAKRTKAKAGANEADDIRAIVKHIHEKTANGLKIIAAAREKLGIEILDARERPGNRGVHYDFEILVGSAPGTWKKVEHKGSQKSTPIRPDEKPWEAGVQFHNGGCEKYTIARIYAHVWHTLYIASGSLKTEWGLTAPIPSFEEWFAKDAKQQDDPKTEFGIELKQKVRAARGERSSLLEKRQAAHDAFNPTDDDLNLLKQEVLAILNEALLQKEFWLVIHGDVNSDSFHCAWFPQFTLGTIDSVTITTKKDIFFNFVCSGVSFKAILRWGKGAGFSNLRLDAR